MKIWVASLMSGLAGAILIFVAMTHVKELRAPRVESAAFTNERDVRLFRVMEAETGAPLDYVIEWKARWTCVTA